MRNRMWMTAIAGALVVMTGCEEQPVSLDAQTPSASFAQAVAGGAEPGAMLRGRNPLRMLLAQREELALSESQVAQLERIAEDLRAQNEPLLEAIGATGRRAGIDRTALQGLSAEERRAKVKELREARRAEREQLSPEQRQALRAERTARMEALRPQLEQLRSNQRTAAEAALAVLTAEQRAAVEAKREARQAERAERGGRGRRDGSGPGRHGRG